MCISGESNHTMKRIIVLLFTTLLALSPVSAQIRVGASLGVTGASVTMPYNQRMALGGSFHFRTGLQAGLIAEYPLKRITLQSGLRFHQAGTTYKRRIEESGFQFKEKVQARTQYLMLPVLVKYSRPLGDYSLYGLAGPCIRYLLSARAKGNMTGDFPMAIDLPMKHRVKSTDWGFILGIGVQKKLYGKTCFVECRYDMGLSNALNVYADDAALGWLAGAEARNRAIVLNLGVLDLL